MVDKKIFGVKRKEFIIGSLVLVGLVLFAVPGLIESIGALFSGEVAHCDDDPFSLAGECFCDEGERKVTFGSSGFVWEERSICEELEALLIDPDSPTFESDAIQFSEDYLIRHCGSEGVNICTDESLQCGDPCIGSTPTFPDNKCVAPSYGFSDSGGRIANIECVRIDEWEVIATGEKITHEEALSRYGNQSTNEIRVSSGTLPWRVWFFVESETDVMEGWELMAEQTYCYNPNASGPVDPSNPNETLGLLCGTETRCDFANSDIPGICEPAIEYNLIPQPPVQSIVGSNVDGASGSGFSPAYPS